MPDVLRLLPPFTWRGKKYPVTSREVSFMHEGVRHKFQYRDGELIEQMGAQALTFTYMIPMREDIAKGPYKELFSKGLAVLLADCTNRERGVLFDPIYGQFNVVPTSYRDSTDVNKRDGTDLTIEFVRSLKQDETDALPTAPSLSGLVSEAGTLDQELEATGEFEQFEGQRGTTDIFSVGAGLAAQVERGGRKVSAGLDDLAFRMKKVDEAIERAENPQLWGLQNSSRNVREGALRLKKRSENPGQRVLQVVQRAQQTVNAVALQVGMSLSDLLALNPELVTSPIVRPGTVIKVAKPSP
jgi:hypothetical protein